MQAVILAAGMGKRLKELTSNNAKCMVKVNGITLIQRALEILDKKKLSRIVLVIGFEGENLKNYVNSLGIQTPLVFVDNQVYDKTNNIYSLLLAKDYMVKEDTLLLESDIIFEESVIDALLEDSRDTLALVDKFASWMDGTCMVLDEDDAICDFIPGKYLHFADKEHYYKTVNLYKFSKEFSANIYIPFLEAYFKAMGVNEYYESVIKLIALLENTNIRAKRLDGQIWYEIDDIQDLDVASTLFANSPLEHYQMISSRYGGYWRYPKLLDFCYLVNPYFPPKKMLEEIKSNFDVLIAQYPSGMKVNSLLAAKNFSLRQEHIVVGNGAAELIKSLAESFTGKTGVITPTFEEYSHRLTGEIVPFCSGTKHFTYTAQDLMDYFSKNKVDNLILINPDNPSGNYLSQEELLSLIAWCKKETIRLVIDESFVDFADENETLECTMLSEEILARYEQLYVVKSISKSYGVPGLRLGILASSNQTMIDQIKKDVAIWNINSFGEFYMQIAEKYKNDYLISLKEIRESRKSFIQELQTISYLKVFPSQANYVMCEVLGGKTSQELVTALLEQNYFIKDLTGKIADGHQYLRLAVRTKSENHSLIEALRSM